jgi:glutamyl-Q tRNA(Asp) synthetase
MQGDFVVLRKDGLVSYQLAVAVDDVEGQNTHVVRGADLLDSTPRQLHLMKLLGLMPPDYGHIPVALDERGVKLSKQFGALPVDSSHASENLYRGLHFLGQSPPSALSRQKPSEILDWGIAHWNIADVPKLSAAPAHNSL